MRAIHRRLFKSLGWLLFLVSVWFVLDFALTARRRLGQIAEYQTAFADQSTGSIRQEMVSSLFIATAAKSAEVTAFYTDRLAGLDDASQLPADVLASARRTVDEARLRIATTEGALAGVFAAEPPVSDVTALRSRLQRMNTSTGILSTFFDDYQTSGPVTALQRLKDQEAWIGVEQVDFQSLQLRAWDEQAAMRASVSSAEQALNELVESFLSRLWVSTLGAMYCAALLAVSLLSRWQH